MDYGDFEASFEDSKSLNDILNVELYLTLEKAREDIIHQALEEINQQNKDQNSFRVSTVEDNELVTEADHIHNKAIFDGLNEALNELRPYGPRGEPMPWSKKGRKNPFFMYQEADCLDVILNGVKRRVLGWARLKAGAIPKQVGRGDDEYYSQLREKCLTQMLISDVRPIVLIAL